MLWKAAAIIQQYGDAAIAEALLKAGFPPVGTPTQPPAADGKLREALEALEFSQTMGRDNKMIGWLRLRPDASKKRGGVQFTVQEPDMLAALQAWHDQSRAALAQPASGGGEKTKDNQNG